MMFYGWVTKLNPFNAARRQTEEAWNKVAEQVANIAKNLSRKEGKNSTFRERISRVSDKAAWRREALWQLQKAIEGRSHEIWSNWNAE
jgi:chromosome segregation ATPase